MRWPADSRACARLRGRAGPRIQGKTAPHCVMGAASMRQQSGTAAAKDIKQANLVRKRSCGMKHEPRLTWGIRRSRLGATRAASGTHSQLPPARPRAQRHSGGARLVHTAVMLMAAGKPAATGRQHAAVAVAVVTTQSRHIHDAGVQMAPWFVRLSRKLLRTSTATCRANVCRGMQARCVCRACLRIVAAGAAAGTKSPCGSNSPSVTSLLPRAAPVLGSSLPARTLFS